MEYIQKWLSIIRNCSFDNTYKMGWAKAIVEIASESTFENRDNEVEITLDQIARKILKYYWDQTIYFDLVQGSNPSKPPVILSVTKKLILEYQRATNDIKPVKYLRTNVEDVINDKYELTIKSIVAALKEDVSYRFPNLKGIKTDEIYRYRKSIPHSSSVAKGNVNYFV